jgi:hypothetical protein
MAIELHERWKLRTGQLAARERVFARFHTFTAPVVWCAGSITSWEEHCKW